MKQQIKINKQLQKQQRKKRLKMQQIKKRLKLHKKTQLMIIQKKQAKFQNLKQLPYGIGFMIIVRFFYSQMHV